MSNLIDIEMMFHAESPGAIFVSDNGDEKRAVWLPRSQIVFEPRGVRRTVGAGATVMVTLPEWLAKAEGLI